MFRPRARYARDWSGVVAVLAPGALPTVDYYLTPRLRGLPAGSVYRFNSMTAESSASSLPDGTFVVIVRHAAPAWLRWLARHRGRWSGVAFLMDDDIPAAWTCGELPLGYRLWTSGRHARVRGLLAAVCDRVWMSNARLQARYPESEARVLPPIEPFGQRPASPPGTRRWAYLGTHVHRREIEWLLPVVNAVQMRSEAFEFELFGAGRVERRFAALPRVRVRAPRPWPEFLRYCVSAQLAVGVAPLLPGRFNAMRTHVKLFDITRCGAAALLSRAEPYGPELEEVAAALLPNDPATWIDAITELLEDDTRRGAVHARAAAWVDQAGREVDLSAWMRERLV